MPGGALLQLAAYGPQDVYLTGNPQISFFIAVYKRHTNFAIETIEEVPVYVPEFGKRTYIKLERYGDLVSQIFLNIRLPQINPDPNFVNSDFAISWINAIGHFIINRVEIEIGGIVIDRHFGQWLDIWTELTMSDDKRCGYFDMVGKHESFNSTTQPGPLNLYIPLIFWFNRNIGLSLPLIALQNHDVRINVVFREFNELWVSSTGKLEELLNIMSPQTENIPCTMEDLKNQLQMEMLFLIDYIYLDEEERRMFAQSRHEYLVELLIGNVYSESLTSVNNIINFNFNHPTEELIWVIQECNLLRPLPNGGNEWCNYSDRSIISNTMPEDPMIEAKLYFEGRERFKERKAKFFRVVQVWERHTYTTGKFIYVYSFSLDPEIYQPMGTANFSRIDNPQINIKVKDTLVDPLFTMYGPYYNILRIENGMAGVVYAN